MSLSDRIAEFGTKWSGWARIISTVVAVLVLFGVGNYIYDQIWKKAELTYTVLQTLDLGDQYFTGLVVSNSGVVPLTDVQIVLADLGSKIVTYNVPGATEPITLTAGGPGFDNITLEMKRLSKGNEISLYILSPAVIDLGDLRKVSISSAETVGHDGHTGPNLITTLFSIILGVALGYLINRITLKPVGRTESSSGGSGADGG